MLFTREVLLENKAFLRDGMQSSASTRVDLAAPSGPHAPTMRTLPRWKVQLMLQAQVAECSTLITVSCGTPLRTMLRWRIGCHRVAKCRLLNAFRQVDAS